MKRYIESKEIMPGQLTELRDVILMAKKKNPHVRCSEQCHLYNSAKERCSGFCYRWDNYRDIVFALTYEPDGDYEVVETPFAANARRIAEQMMEQMKEEMHMTSNEPQD